MILFFLLIFNPLFANEPDFDIYYNNTLPIECMKFLTHYRTSLLTISKCIIKYSTPIHICQKCVDPYLSFLSSYNNVIQSEKLINITDINTNQTYYFRCAQQILYGDFLQPLRKSYDFYVGLWTNAHCQNCYIFYNDTKTGIPLSYSLTNFSQNFYMYYLELKNCENNFTQQIIKNETFCKFCQRPYLKLNKFFYAHDKLFYSEGKTIQNEICADILYLMNVTHKMWKNEYGCQNFGHKKIPVIYFHTMILCLPVLFYVYTYVQSNKKEKVFVETQRFTDYYRNHPQKPSTSAFLTVNENTSLLSHYI